MRCPRSAQTTPTTPSALLCDTKDPFGYPEAEQYRGIFSTNLTTSTINNRQKYIAHRKVDIEISDQKIPNTLNKYLMCALNLTLTQEM
uniref:Uncharacterized protein n=1 Tax=Romanomermis culicivorax TaxID=13658 RepID=A0A915JFY2_ROMCU